MWKWWFKSMEWLELQSRWSVLRSLGSSNLVKASVLMPAFGYMLLLNDNVHQYLTIKYDAQLLTFMPALWRVWLLFYGSFLLALATVLYTIYCPQNVKRYATPYERADAQTEYLQRLGSIKGLKDDLDKAYKGMSSKEKKIFTLKGLDLTANPVDVQAQLKFISNSVIHLWLISNNETPLLRILILILYACGLLLIAIPAILTFIQVTLLAAKRIFL